MRGSENRQAPCYQKEVRRSAKCPVQNRIAPSRGEFKAPQPRAIGKGRGKPSQFVTLSLPRHPFPEPTINGCVADRTPRHPHTRPLSSGKGNDRGPTIPTR